jgi:acetylglutamate/LysW-gamma-L-alpha-aminoadipate kinase
MVIVKVGGGKNINLDFVCEDFASLVKKEKAILIHGGHAKRDEIAKKLGHPTKTITSPSGINSVYTDQKAIEIFLMVYPGLMNKKIVAKLQSFGVNAIGLSGIDGRLWEGKRKKAILAKEGEKIKLIRDDLSGKVEKINAKILEILLKENFVPVVCPPAISYEGEIINVDSDPVVVRMAKELKAEKIIFLFEAPGLLRDERDEKSLISYIPKEKIDEYLIYAKGRMRRKILAAKEAIEAGVKEIYFGDGRIEKPITLALEGKGTLIS